MSRCTIRTFSAVADLFRSLPAPRVPFEYKDKALPALPVDLGSSTSSSTPFIHAATQGKAKVSKPLTSIIAQNEVAEFAVSLRNPLDVPMEVQSLELWCVA